MKMICQNMTCGEMMMKELKRKQLNHHQNLKSTPLNDPEVNPDPEIGTARDLEVHQVPARTPQDPVAEVVGPEIEGAPRDPARGREEGKVAEDTPAPLAAVHGDAQGRGPGEEEEVREASNDQGPAQPPAATVPGPGHEDQTMEGGIGQGRGDTKTRHLFVQLQCRTSFIEI